MLTKKTISIVRHLHATYVECINLADKCTNRVWSIENIDNALYNIDFALTEEYGNAQELREARRELVKVRALLTKIRQSDTDIVKVDNL